MPEKCETLEELRWTPGLADCDLKMYLRAARSMAAFAGMCDGGSAEDGCLAASRDDTTINALQLLHESNYDTGKALQALVKSPVPKGIEKKWTEEEQKRFVKGLRLYGKNFFKIRKELLSHKETPDLVEYYYLWKKTPQAASARPHRRHRRCVLRRIRKDSGNNANSNSNNSQNNKANSKEEASSASEEEVEQTDDSDSNANSDLTCSNCGVLAKELHQTGTDRSLLCNECRSYMKKHGKHRPVDEKAKVAAGKGGEEDSNLSNGKPNLRTRKGKEKGSKSELHRGSSKSSETSSPDGNEINSIESCSNSSEAKPTNGSATTSEGESKRSEIPKKRHFSNLDKVGENDPSTSEHLKDGDSEAKRKKLSSEDAFDEDAEEDGEGKEAIKEETAAEEKSATEEEKEPGKECASEVVVKDEADGEGQEPQPEESNSSVKEEKEKDEEAEESGVKVKDDSEGGKESSTTASVDAVKDEEEKMDVDIVPDGAESKAKDKDKEESAEVPQGSAAEEGAAEAGNKPDKVDSSNLLTNMKVEPPSSPKSPQDLSTSREKRTETNVPSTSSQTFTSSTTTSSSASSPAIKKEDNSAAALNFSTAPASGTGKVSPSSSPNPMGLFPFSQNFSQIPPPLAAPTSMADRYPYLMPPLSFPPGVAMNPDVVSSSPKLPSATSEKAEGEHRLKDEPKSTEPNKSKSGESSARNLPSPKTISSSAPTFPSMASPFTSTPNDPFLMSNPNFAPPHMAGGGERLPFPNPLINYPPGFSPHIPGLPPFMNPWSQYATAARLPPGAFPSPYLPPSASPISSHSPHSQMSKSKSPITSQSGSHHSSPSHFSSMKTHDNKDTFERRDRDVYQQQQQQQEDDDMDNNSYLPRGPSPEPKIEDSECHRSQSAIFLRHWNRGDYNSCARTDLTFKPVPDSQLSRKREERARKAAEKEREDHKKSFEKPPAPLELKPSVNHGPPQQSSSSHESAHLMSPLGGRHTPRNFDTPALRQLSEYARPHSTYSPFSHPQMAHHMAPSNMPTLGMHGPNPTGASPIDQMALAAQYQMLKDAEEKQKLAMLEKQKELEMKSRSAANSQHAGANLPPTSSASSLFDQHLLEMQRRFAGSAQAMSNSPSITNNPSVSSANGLPLSAPGTPLNPFMSMFPPNERAAQEMQQMAAAAMALHTDRYNAERLASMDPLLRLQMSLNPELAAASAAAGHPFQHPLHSVHPGAHSASGSSAENAAATMQLANAAAAMGLQPGSQFDPAQLHASHPLLQSGAYPSRPPSIMPRPELAAAQQASLFRSFEDQLSHQLSAQAALQHEQLQRQMLERERIQYLATAASHMPHAQAYQLQEEYLRQRERELKLRGFDDARNGRPPM